MGRGQKKLTDTFVKRCKYKGRYGDGAGLYLVVRKNTLTKSWSFVWIRHGIRREIGLGGYPTVSLAQARLNAEIARNQISAGLDPKAERDKDITKTFGEVADLVLDEIRPSWTNPKHGAQWERSFNVHCKAIRSTPIDEIKTDDVLKVLSPVWKATPETGRRLRSRIERVLSYAQTHGWRTGENVARWRGHLEHVFTIKDKVKEVKHFASMPYKLVPGFVKQLQEMDTIPSMALEFLILTAARTGEVLGAAWSEIDLDAALWSIPAERMKMKKAHTVPLTPRAVAILKPLYAVRTSNYIFPGKKPGKPLSNMSMAMIIRRMGIEGATVHGFRSSFRDFAGDETTVAEEICEAALAHSIGSKVRSAYRRSDALERRRGLMQLWADYCAGDQTGGVVRLHG